MTSESQLLRVACPREMQHATNQPNSATDNATSTQQPGLKALAQHVIGRNTLRNSSATNPPNERNNPRNKEGGFVAPQDDVASLIASACEGLTITPEQLLAELTEGGDMPDLQSGSLTPQALRLTARTLALMRYPYGASKEHFA